MSTKILKTVNLIRHAQSEHNIAPIFQSPEAKLSDEGVKQAQLLAARVSQQIPYQVLISSSYTRAIKTALAIDCITWKGISLNDLFVERKKPSSVEGKPTDDLSALETWTKWHESFYNDRYNKIEDGESFFDLIGRVENCLHYLEHHRPEELMVVVSHGLIIRSIVAYLMIGPGIDQASYRRAVYSIGMENTAITQINLEVYKDTAPKWVVNFHNDYNHLK